MLRNKAVVSDIRDFTETKFRSVLEEPTYQDGIGDRSKITRILLCSGKLYYDLAARKAKDNRDDVAIVRIEQLAPLPNRRLANTLDGYPNATEFFWVQEEPANQGAWPTFGLDAAGAAARALDRPQAHLAARDVGAVVGVVEGARRRTAGNHRRSLRLSLFFAASVRVCRCHADTSDILGTDARGGRGVHAGFAGKVASGQRRGFGIGQALAIVVAHSGAKLAISDIDTEGLAATEERLDIGRR